MKSLRANLAALSTGILPDQKLSRRQRETVRMPLLEEIHIFNGGFKVPKLLKQMTAANDDPMDLDEIWKGFTKRRNGNKEPGPLVKRVQVYYEYRQDTKKYTGEKLRALEIERGCGKRKKKAA